MKMVGKNDISLAFGENGVSTDLVKYFLVRSYNILLCVHFVSPCHYKLFHGKFFIIKKDRKRNRKMEMSVTE